MMKRILFLLLAVANFCILSAQVTDGYYRIQNVGSSRFLYVKDNRGSINPGTTTAEMGAIELWTKYERAISDPSSILFVHHVSDNAYRFRAQGTDTYEIIGYDLLLRKNRDGSYKAYQSKQGMTQYLCDAEVVLSVEESRLGTNDSGTNFRDWNFRALTLDESSYFGVKSEVEVAGEYYATLYGDFPFQLGSPNMKVYYISKVDKGMAVLAEFKEDWVPAATPVLVKCASNQPNENKLEIGMTKAHKYAGNQLGGVYFHNKTKKHRNLTPYNAQTMRLLGVTSDGKIGFVTDPTCEYLPANKAYLKVPAGTPEELIIVTQKEYEDHIAAGVDNVIVNEPQGDNLVYSVSGAVVGKGHDALKHLPAGVYVINGKKFINK